MKGSIAMAVFADISFFSLLLEIPNPGSYMDSKHFKVLKSVPLDSLISCERSASPLYC